VPYLAATRVTSEVKQQACSIIRVYEPLQAKEFHPWRAPIHFTSFDRLARYLCAIAPIVRANLSCRSEPCMSSIRVEAITWSAPSRSPRFDILSGAALAANSPAQALAFRAEVGSRRTKKIVEAVRGICHLAGPIHGQSHRKFPSRSAIMGLEYPASDRTSYRFVLSSTSSPRAELRCY